MKNTKLYGFFFAAGRTPTGFGSAHGLSKKCIIAASVFLLPLLWSCGRQEEPGGRQPVPEGMVEVRPVLSGAFNAIPRPASDVRSGETRVYEDNSTTNGKLGKLVRLPEGSTVWIIAKNEKDNSYVRKSYAVYNPEGEEVLSYLVPCSVNEDGEIIDMEGTPLYLKEGSQYLFYAISPARKLDYKQLEDGKMQVGFRARNGEAFYANDVRYENTTPERKTVTATNTEAVQEIKLSPMINQTAQLKFRIEKGHGVHDLDIQPSGIQISGLQSDEPDGVEWHMSQTRKDEPIVLKHSDRGGIYNDYDYEIDLDGRVNLEVPVLPMRSLSKPIIVVFRLKINGVPTSFEMMLNEKDFKAGYSYGYRGSVSIKDNIDVITWQFVSWDTDVEFPFE